VRTDDKISTARLRFVGCESAPHQVVICIASPKRGQGRQIVRGLGAGQVQQQFGRIDASRHLELAKNVPHPGAHVAILVKPATADARDLIGACPMGCTIGDRSNSCNCGWGGVINQIVDRRYVGLVDRIENDFELTRAIDIDVGGQFVPGLERNT
jgi:hypothetical protein